MYGLVWAWAGLYNEWLSCALGWNGYIQSREFPGLGMRSAAHTLGMGWAENSLVRPRVGHRVHHHRQPSPNTTTGHHHRLLPPTSAIDHHQPEPQPTTAGHHRPLPPTQQLPTTSTYYNHHRPPLQTAIDHHYRPPPPTPTDHHRPPTTSATDQGLIWAGYGEGWAWADFGMGSSGHGLL